MRASVAAVVLAALALSAPARAADSMFVAWESAATGRTQDVQAFEAYLKQQGVGDVLPLPELLLDASSWRACTDSPYDLPPRALWHNVVPTLQFIRAHIIPVLGPVAAVSGYRSPELNACAGGARKSAHAQYYALDLTPLNVTDRDKMIADVCALHARYGKEANVGLGFYEGMRFHIDTMGYRRWGTDYHAATSPCAILEAQR